MEDPAPPCRRPQKDLDGRPSAQSPAVPTDHALGAYGVPVVRADYGDFAWPGCKQAADFPAEARFTFGREPPEELQPHGAAESAGAQGRFWPMYKLLFDHHSPFRVADLQSYAASLRQASPRTGARSVVHTTAFFMNGTLQDAPRRLSPLIEAGVLEARDG